MSSKKFLGSKTKKENMQEASKFVDLILRVVAIAMGISAVTLMVMNVIAVEYAIILLGIGMVAMALERLSDK